MLAQHFTLVLADLRGYGDSAKPAGDAEHLRYSKRTMAADMLAVMAHFVAAMHEHTDVPVVDIAKGIEIKALEAVNTTQSNEPDPLHRPA